VSVSFPALDVYWSVEARSTPLSDHLYAVLDEFEPQAIHDHETGDGWRVFFRTASDRDLARRAILEALSNQLASVSAVDVPDDDWARRSQAGVTAVRVGQIVVAPPWDLPPDSAPADIVIVIDPSTGFGTGHHETTRLCLALLQEIEVKDRRAIDAGTGSGVLAIAAWKLGAASVLAFDEDPEALRNARENVERNHASNGVAVVEASLGGSSRRVGFDPADVVLANLTAGVLLRYGADLMRSVQSEGALIVSGFAPDELQDIERTFGRSAERRAVEGDWAAALFRVSHDRTRN
jgi:ribosomal protein L11 methyltransferase